MKDYVVENAKITNTFLGKEDHGIMTLYITVEFNGGGCNYGGYILDGYDKSTKKRVCSPLGLQSVCEIIDTVGVDSWEKLQGQYIRVERNELGGRIARIGNIIKDKWLSLEDFFTNNQSNPEGE